MSVSTVAWPRTLIVMPAFNEEAGLAKAVNDVRANVPFADVVVVDDGSRDGTARVARELGVTVLQLPFNLGIGGAVRAGFVYARDNGYEAVVQVDSDGQHDAKYVSDLVAALSNADVVIGSRFAADTSYRVSWSRRFAMKVLAFVLGKMINQKLTDATSGFRASGPRAIPVLAAEMPAEYLGDCVEGMIICRKADLTFAEVPVVMRQRETGTPSQGPVGSAIHLGRAFIVILLAASRSRPSTGEG